MANSSGKTLVWDLPLRLFHWSLVILIFYAWYSVEVANDLDQHFLTGYAILALLIFRILWGFVGPENARFSSFIKGPSEVMAYIRHQNSYTHSGHNPLGALSVVLMLAILVTQVVTGLFSDDEYYYFGPLSGYISGSTVGVMTEIHDINFNVILGIVVLHILAIVYYAVIRKQRLVPAMITGYKSDPGQELSAISGSKPLLAVICLLIGAGIAWGISTLGN